MTWVLETPEAVGAESLGDALELLRQGAVMAGRITPQEAASAARAIEAALVLRETFPGDARIAARLQGHIAGVEVSILWVG